MSKFTQGQLDGYRDLKVLPLFKTEQSIYRMLDAKKRIMVDQGGKNIVWDVRLSAQTLKSAGKYQDLHRQRTRRLLAGQPAVVIPVRDRRGERP